MIGVLYILLSFFIVLASLAWGISYTRKNIDKERTIKYRPTAYFITIGLILSIGYVFGAKKLSEHIDLILNWMILATGFLFSSTVCFLVAFLREKTTL